MASATVIEAQRRNRLVDGVTSPDANEIVPTDRLNEICKLLRDASVDVLRKLVEYILNRLDHTNPIVQLKTLKLIKYAAGNGGQDFKRFMQGQVGKVRSKVDYQGQTEDLKEAIRTTARETIDAIFISKATTTIMEGGSKPQAPSSLEENVAKLEASFGPDGHAGIVGKTEGRFSTLALGKSENQNSPGKLESNVGKAESQASSHLEENIAKLEASFGPDGHAGIVGKTEGRYATLAIGRSDNQNSPGKLENNVGKAESKNAPGKLETSVGKAECQNAPGKLEKSVGKTESHNAPGKLEKSVGKAESHGKTKSQDAPGKLESSVGKAESQGKTESLDAPGKLENKVGKAEGQGTPGKLEPSVGKAERKNVSGKTESTLTDGEKKVIGKVESYISGQPGSGHAECVIQLASKGSVEEDYVEKLKSGAGLQLPDDAIITTVAKSTDTSAELFDVNAYFESLRTLKFGRLVLYSSLIPSTHTLLSQNFHSIPAGTICIAAGQLAGRGRAGNSWQSPKGCLMFSYTTQMTNGHMVPFLQYVVSIAVIEAVEETCETSGLPAPDLRIKWPNDLYAKGIKIGGVLCTSSYRAKTFNIVMGVGLNVGNREPTTCLDALIEEIEEGAPTIRQEQLLACIMSRFEELNETFQGQGFTPLQEAYYSKWLHSGQSVVLEEKEPGSTTTSHVSVTIQGLTPAGYLLATDNVGEQYELHPDGNSFDFLKGLVRTKLYA